MNPGALDQVLNEPSWRNFVRQVLFHSHSINVRGVACQQFYSIATKCTGNYNALTFFIIFLFEIIQSSVREIPQNAINVFHLLCNLLRYSHTCNIALPKHEHLLSTQIEWLRQAKVSFSINSKLAIVFQSHLQHEHERKRILLFRRITLSVTAKDVYKRIYWKVIFA